MDKPSVIILGCGHLGSLLATLLDRQGALVLVIDPDGETLTHLPPEVRSRAIESDTLAAVVDPHIPVSEARAVIAVTGSDERNVALALVCHAARPTQRVLAYVSDPARAKSYERTGIEPIDATHLAAVEILRKLGDGTGGDVPAPESTRAASPR